MFPVWMHSTQITKLILNYNFAFSRQKIYEKKLHYQVEVWLEAEKKTVLVYWYNFDLSKNMQTARALALWNLPIFWYLLKF